MRISCMDRFERPRALEVLTVDDQVLLVVPAGEVAVLSQLEVELLRGALADAVAAVPASNREAM